MQEVIRTERLELKPVSREEPRNLSESQSLATTDSSYLKKALECYPKKTHAVVAVLHQL